MQGITHRRVGGAAQLLDEEGDALLGRGLVCQANLAQRHPCVRLHGRHLRQHLHGLKVQARHKLATHAPGAGALARHSVVLHLSA
jgi:hypothetical protein